jgi:hypothetical protein
VGISRAGELPATVVLVVVGTEGGFAVWVGGVVDGRVGARVCCRCGAGGYAAAGSVVGDAWEFVLREGVADVLVRGVGGHARRGGPRSRVLAGCVG